MLVEMESRRGNQKTRGKRRDIACNHCVVKEFYYLPSTNLGVKKSNSIVFLIPVLVRKYIPITSEIEE